ncbi:MAG: hypothetical protein EBR85_01275 [Betaproteobacteria bacterium]|nr:hypothetical protein [Betaproteobacteria bacterium]
MKTENGSRKAAFSFIEANTGAPLPGLAASAANRIPRWLLILIVLLYIGHGLFYRDPWRGDDMLGLALARTTAESLLRGDFSLLLLPQLGDLAWNQQGPLWTAILAVFMLPAYFWAAVTQSPLPIHLLDDLARVPVALAMALGLVAVWKATDRFARRREAQPVDPLGLGPRAPAFGKTLGDCALLLTIAVNDCLNRCSRTLASIRHCCCCIPPSGPLAVGTRDCTRIAQALGLPSRHCNVREPSDAWRGSSACAICIGGPGIDLSATLSICSGSPANSMAGADDSSAFSLDDLHRLCTRQRTSTPMVARGAEWIIFVSLDYRRGSCFS